jgi:hypothetical protein
LLETIFEASDNCLYADCQDGVEALVGYLTILGWEDSEITGLLEQFYVLLYKVSIGEIDGKPLEECKKALTKCAKRDFCGERIEVVFLSHIASMSDSMESIYLAAKQDPDCDAFWIPIPYYNQDSLMKECYEGAQCYSDKIVCTDYREYDIAIRHPDVIFTFNPYDNSNMITSVSPEYFCENLKENTDCLVYIPYGTSGKNIVKYDWFCTLPGNVYADMVFVESDFVRAFYAKSLRKALGDNVENAESKFIALGSPKYDKVIRAKREDHKLHDEWEKIIGDKEVVLYNTSVTTLVSHEHSTEQFLEKIRTVIDTFKHRDDMIIWWRPHPTTESTIKTMMPSLFKDYKNIRDDLINGSFGIYDDTTDLHRAIAWSDMHYGDENSVMRLYEVTGKPIYLQDFFSKLNPWSTPDTQSGDVITESERKPIPLTDDFAYNLDGTSGEIIWEYVKKEVSK